MGFGISFGACKPFWATTEMAELRSSGLSFGGRAGAVFRP